MKQEQNLTPKQQLFVEVYLDTNNAVQAYKDAGYSISTENVMNSSASRMLRNVNISQVIAKSRSNNLAKQAKKREKIDINETWLINRYLDVIDGAMKSKHWNAARNCITDIGKLTGHVYDRKSIELQGTIDHAIQNLDSDQLIQALTEARQPKAIEAEFHEIAEE